jgi:hypothetical protein
VPIGSREDREVREGERRIGFLFFVRRLTGGTVPPSIGNFFCVSDTPFLRNLLFFKVLQRTSNCPIRLKVGQFEMGENLGRKIIESGSETCQWARRTRLETAGYMNRAVTACLAVALREGS